jgi:hypothetical protein
MLHILFKKEKNGKSLGGNTPETLYPKQPHGGRAAGGVPPRDAGGRWNPLPGASYPG